MPREEHQLDLAFLHPPPSFSKLQRPLSGVFESSVGTTDMLTMVAVGVYGLAHLLEDAGHSTRVFNVARALQMQRENPSLDTWEYVDRIDARIYGVSLHWSVHAPGAIEIAQRIKQKRPDATIMFGGMTATTYYRELLEEHPYIDVVALGECEHIIVDLVGQLMSGGDLSTVDNLAFLREGQVHVTSTSLPEDFRGAGFHADDRLVDPPPARFDRERVMQTYPLIRGCYRDCRFCGGSRYAYANTFFRPRHAPLGLEHFEGCLRDMLEHGAQVLKLCGDTRSFGSKYDAAMREAINKSGGTFDVALEVFSLPSLDYLEAWRKVSHNMVLILSPESTFEDLRRIHGKNYSNDDILRVGDWCEELGIHLIFCLMYAMPGHTRERILGELDFYEEIVRRYPKASMMFQPYLYVDPASEIWANPEQFGARIHFKTLRQIINGLTRPHWYHAIGYELENLSKDELFLTILEVARRKAWIYHRHNRLSANNLAKTHENILLQRKVFDFIHSEDPDDSVLSQFIESTFPSYLRASNTNLIQRPFIGSITQNSYDLEAAAYEAFPTISELLIGFGLVDVDEFVRQVHSLRSTLLFDKADLWDLRNRWVEWFERMASKNNIGVPFLAELVAFEWCLYLHYYLGESRNVFPVIMSTRHNYDSITELLGSVHREGRNLELDPETTEYRFEPGAPISKSRKGLRRLNVFSRKTFRLDPAVKTMLRTQHGVDCDEDYTLV